MDAGRQVCFGKRRKGWRIKEGSPRFLEIENPLEVNNKVEDVVKESIGSEWIDKGADPIFPRDAQSTITNMV